MGLDVCVAKVRAQVEVVVVEFADAVTFVLILGLLIRFVFVR